MGLNLTPKKGGNKLQINCNCVCQATPLVTNLATHQD